jgi:hypothetical protein
MLEAAQCKLRGHARSRKDRRPRFYTAADETGKEVRHEINEERDVCSRCGEPSEGPLGKWKLVIEDAG